MRLNPRHKHRLAGNPRCPLCNSRLDGFTAISDKDVTPRHGDISICCYCATPLMVEGETWVRLTGEDLAEALADPRFQRALAAVEIWRRQRRQ
jgi:hypothetical protein